MRFVLKTRNDVLKARNCVLKTNNCVLKAKNCALKVRNCVLKARNCVLKQDEAAVRAGAAAAGGLSGGPGLVGPAGRGRWCRCALDHRRDNRETLESCVFTGVFHYHFALVLYRPHLFCTCFHCYFQRSSPSPRRRRPRRCGGSARRGRCTRC